MNDVEAWLKCLKMTVVASVIGMGLIMLVQVVDGPTHRLGVIEFHE